VPGDIELVRERIHPATMAAEGPLHELGAIAIVNSDSQGMGRIGETVRRTVQLAHVMKGWRRGVGAPDRAVPAFAGLPPERAGDPSTTPSGSCGTWPSTRAGHRPRHLDEV
jgi:hypothetical protein